MAEPTRHVRHADREKGGDSYVYSALFTVDRWRHHLDWNGFAGISLNTKVFSFRRFGEGTGGREGEGGHSCSLVLRYDIFLSTVA